MRKNVVVIGGGTGAYTVLTALKQIPGINITAIVASTDSGGSTGRLRDHFGRLPVGDFRQCLVALAQGENDDNILREVFKYRFAKGGEGLEGHNLGNLFITALTDILGSEEKALHKVSKILNIKGRVFPVTFQDIQLAVEYEDGSIAYGEAMIDDPSPNHDGTLKIKQMWTQPKAFIHAKSEAAIKNADLIIMGPGDLYTSTLANIVVNGVPNAMQKSGARIIYITNLVSRYGQTYGYKTSDYIKEIEKYCGVSIDYILVDTNTPSKTVMDKYAEEKSFLVLKDMKDDSRVITGDFLLKKIIKRKKGDKIKRSLLRHDPKKLQKIIKGLL